MQLFGLADCNNFYCSCERVFHPDLVGRPVVVLSNNDGCVIARSEESKRLGIKMGTAFFQVKDVLEKEGVAVFSSNYNLYGDMSRRVHTMLGRYTPKVDIYSIDEAFIDLSDMGDSEYIADYGRRIVREVTKGTGIPISLGVAPTKTLAKMGSKFAKKHPGYKGCCLIDTEEKREKALKLFPIEDVWGIGWRSVQKLKYHGVKTAWDLTQKPREWVRRMLTITGERTWRELRGESCISIDELPHKQSICTSRSFPDSGLSRLADVEEAIANFAARCSAKMRKENTVCQAITIFAYTNRFRPEQPTDYIYQTFHPLVATADLNEVVGYAVKMLRAVWKGDGKFHYKKAGVLVWNIIEA
ncbi:MAG: Y-family DNA polymerase, partial [Bacteroidales bacterium]|nr:Y-family DNA polymerase [Bacteroidales bacterium]